jgi:uncharacterized protein YdcH (DUF465 family)
MPFSDLSTAQIKTLIRLVRKKESLQAKIDKVDAALRRLDGVPASVPPLKKRHLKARRRKRITLKDSILAVLAAAGTKGLSVKEIATKAGAKHGSVSVWIYTTGKKVTGLKKIAPGRYAFKG